MNLVTSDASGLFLLPLGTTLNLTAWDTFNELGLVFLPFMVLFVASWAKAFTQGADEGSAGVLIIKYTEKGFYLYIAVIMIFLTPISNKIDVSYRQYSCLDNPSISSNAMKDINKASDSVLASLGIHSDSIPLGLGFLHNVFNGINGAAISQMSCSKGASKSEVSRIVANSIPKTESTYLSAREFNEKCYTVAKNVIRRDLATNKEFKNPQDVSEKNGWGFKPANWGSQLMMDVYDNVHLKAGGDLSGVLTMEVPDTWFDATARGSNAKCSVLAESLYSKLESDMTSSSTYAENEKRVLAYTQMFNPKSTKETVKHDLVNIIFDNAVNGDASQQLLWSDAQTSKNVAASLGIATPTTEGEQYLKNMEQFENKEMSIMNSFSNVVVSIGSVFANIEESAKGLAVAMMLPTMVVMTKVVLLGSFPLLVVISGFSGKFIYNWILLYFAISLVPFWINVALQFETMLLSMSDYSESITVHLDNIMEQNGVNIYLVSSTAATFVYLLPTIWIMLIQIIGNVGGSAFMNMVAGAAVVGQTGSQATVQGMLNTGKGLTNMGINQLGKNSKSGLGQAPQGMNNTNMGGNAPRLSGAMTMGNN